MKSLIKSTCFRFSSRATAITFARKASGMMVALLGDDGMFWVVTASDAGRLMAAGCEEA